MKLSLWEILGCLFAAAIVIGVLYIIATRAKYMDEISWVLAFVSIVAAFAFVGWTLILKNS